MPTDADVLRRALDTVERAAHILSLAKILGHVQPLTPEAIAALQALR